MEAKWETFALSVLLLLSVLSHSSQKKISYSPEPNIIHISLPLCQRRLREDLFCARVGASYNLVIDIRINNGGMNIRLLNISGDFVPYTHAKLISLDTMVRNMTTIIQEISVIDIEGKITQIVERTIAQESFKNSLH